MADYYGNTSDYSASMAAPFVPEMSTLPQEPLDIPVRHNPVVQPTMQYNASPFDFNTTNIITRAIKYLFEGLAVAFVAHTFTRGKLELKEVVMLGITAAFVFAILDTFSPTVSLGARFGAGFGIGQSIFGVAPGMML